jgi:hypothetical protein
LVIDAVSEIVVLIRDDNRLGGGRQGAHHGADGQSGGRTGSDRTTPTGTVIATPARRSVDIATIRPTHGDTAVRSPRRPIATWTAHGRGTIAGDRDAATIRPTRDIHAPYPAIIDTDVRVPHSVDAVIMEAPIAEAVVAEAATAKAIITETTIPAVEAAKAAAKAPSMKPAEASPETPCKRE